MLMKNLLLSIRARRCSTLSYVQGQSPAKNVREYFYYIDHEGMLFLDDARIKNFTSCFKEKKFLEFFFKRLRLNDSDRYREHFPFVSPCGRERNYVRCDDVPIVFSHIFQDTKNNDCLSYAHADELLSVPWEPNRICMFPISGRVYHPAPERYGSIGLVRSKLAIELSKHFTFSEGEEKPPTYFSWNGVQFELDRDWWKNTYIGRRAYKLE
ncbi:UPF0598 protein CG30010 [Wyeomyia smithii]|uniref:UPF0598 protein CG30010 n=1 Tax=Wyeomyia smithii TaxID=174621 RepID=UPI002467CA0E|nr:UPF0598 protein CG30010 [Wyeomyia smithii]